MNAQPVPTHDVVRALLDPATPSNDPAVQFIQVMFSGFGYDFYDPRNNARANDLIVRERASGRLADAGQHLLRLEHAYRERYIPPATRAAPYPPADALRRAKAIDTLVARCRAVATAIITSESPASDAIWSRVRDERTTLERLLAFDIELVSACDAIEGMARELDVDGAHADDGLDGLGRALEGVDRSLAQRRALIAV